MTAGTTSIRTSCAEFLVDIQVRLPAEIPAETRSTLQAEELRRGRELKAAGVIRHIWRVPGALHNIGVWCAADATELHELITSLPLHPYMTVEVTALAVHPINSST